MSLPSRLSRMAHRFFSQLVTEEESEIDEVDEVFEPHNEDLTVEYDTCVDICSVVNEAVVSEAGVVNEAADVVNEAADVTEEAAEVADISEVAGISEVDNEISSVVESSVSSGYVADVSDKNIAATIVSETPKHSHSQTVKITTTPRLRRDLSDSEMSGISDASEVDSDAPLTDVINGIVRQRRKEALREAKKRSMKKRNKGFKIAKPHKRVEHKAKELEAIERQLKEE